MKKELYSAPETEVLDFVVENGILQMSLKATRESYGDAEVLDWS